MRRSTDIIIKPMWRVRCATGRSFTRIFGRERTPEDVSVHKVIDGIGRDVYMGISGVEEAWEIHPETRETIEHVVPLDHLHSSLKAWRNNRLRCLYETIEINLKYVRTTHRRHLYVFCTRVAIIFCFVL